MIPTLATSLLQKTLTHRQSHVPQAIERVLGHGAVLNVVVDVDGLWHGVVEELEIVRTAHFTRAVCPGLTVDVHHGGKWRHRLQSCPQFFHAIRASKNAYG